VTLIVDASVATQWILIEANSSRARALRDQGGLIAPSLIAAEVGNALWKAVRRDGISKQDALDAIRAILLAFDALIPIKDLRLRALELAVALDHPIYDCFYLALAERERCALVTADKRLLAATRRVKSVDVRAL
jgi:predicted nucleic acid-binding protein